MSTEAVAPSHDAPVAADVAVKEEGQIECAKPPAPTFLHSPPDSNNAAKSDASDSELSDLDEEPSFGDAPLPAPVPAPDADNAVEEEEDIGEILPDHWTNGVPVFKPDMRQFKDFKRFMEKVDSYGMRSGIIKIIPPQEWKDSLPELDELVKRVKVREPIKQDIMGSNGTYRQVNILHGRSYNIPQWRQLCEQSEHQPPARRGERRANADKPRVTRARAAVASKPANSSSPKPRGRGRPAKVRGRGRAKAKQQEEKEEDRPMTPVSPKPVPSIEKDPGENVEEGQDAAPAVGRMGGVRQAKSKVQSVSARRKYSRREGSAMIDEEAFKDFDYRMNISEYTLERCEELERAYWKTLTYAQPLYGADLMGTLFDEKTELWNLNKLPNLLDVLGTKVPGVNTAYLYLGMWKATFAWHLEDVDLYSINYLHFGAPKQWYSISQADARRFEAAMKNVWPTDAKACDQFLRHKAFLISPQHLLSNYGIKANKCVSYPGEFVVTYPYGYHSGYNLGYNCAEAVNFALDSWLEMGKIAKKCECAQAQDSVWVDVYEIERKLRGEETEYEETEEEEEEDDDDEMSGLPTPPDSLGVRFQESGRKRKRGPGEKGGKVKVKKIKLRIKSKVDPPCCLCPSDFAAAELLPTDDGRKAHRMCALYLPETYIDTVDGKEVVSNAARIHKDRLDLKCMYCRSKHGACFQCSQKKCARAYHATCAAAAGVFIEEEEVPVFGEDGTEYKEQAFEFSCRFHRTKRDKKLDGDALENDARIKAAAAALKTGEICQLQYYKGEIFAGVVVENRADEQTLLIDVIPNGDCLEVEWKWLLVPDPADYHLPKASANALPLPSSQKAKDLLNAKRHDDDKPRKDDRFGEGLTWAEFQLQEVKNKDQVKVDFVKPDQIWHYLGKTSTERRAQYTESPSIPRYNPKGNFLNTVPKPPRPVPAMSAQRMQPYGATGTYGSPYSTHYTNATAMAIPVSTRPEKPYVYKPKKPIDPQFGSMGMFTAQRYASATSPSTPQGPSYAYFQNGSGQGCQSANTYSIQRFKSMPNRICTPGQHHAPLPAPAYAGQQPGQHHWKTPAGPANPPRGCNTSAPAPVSYPAQAPAPAVAPTPAPAPAPVPPPSQPRQQTKPTWHVHSSIYQKYQFFQVHHNRDSSKYRTPYSVCGGFTNGYQGDLRAHLMANQNDLLRGQGFGRIPPCPSSQSAGTPASYNSTYNRPPGGPSQSSASPYTAHHTAGPVQQQPPAQKPPVSTPPQRQLPPAIKAQYLPKSFNMSKPSQPPAPSASKPKPAPTPVPPSTSTQAPAQRAYKIPPKESPVPLPANFLAAMTSTPGTPTSIAKPASQDPAKPNVNTGGKSQPSTPGQAGTPATQAKASPVRTSQASTPKISTTPVPIPKLPGMPVQHTAAPAVAVQASSRTVTSTGPPPISQTPTHIPAQHMRVPCLVNEPASDRSIPATALAQPHQLTTSTAGLRVTTTGLGITQPSTQQPMPHVTDSQNKLPVPEGFPDVPGCESMQFVEKMMANLRRVSQSGNAL